MIVSREMSVILKRTAPCTNSAAREALAQFGDSLEKVAVSDDLLVANFQHLYQLVKPQFFILLGYKKAAEMSAAFAVFGYGISIA